MTAAWGEITAGEIVRAIKGTLVSGDPGTRVAGLSTDTRRITTGELFLALRGERFDGHKFISKAIEQNASGIIGENDADIPEEGEKYFVIKVDDSLRALGDLANWWRLQHDVVVAGITGSAGKTTTKEMTANILNLGRRTLKTEGNLNNLIGLPLTLLRLGERDRAAVLEMGMNRPGEIGRLTKISQPDVGLITNVARAHLEGLGNIEGVARAKAELIERISDMGKVIVNGDDSLLMREASRFGREISTFGLGKANDIRAEKIEYLRDKGVSFYLKLGEESFPVRLGVPGSHNLLNALAAASITINMNETTDHIVEGLENFKGMEGRFHPITLSGDVVLVDDTYNSNPHSLKAALDAVRDIRGDRRIIVGLGEMMELGDETISAHREAGEMVADLGVSYFFMMGEHSVDMTEGALLKDFPRERIIQVESHDEMIKKIREKIKRGDLVLLKGSRKAGLDSVAQGLKEQQ